MPISLDNVGTTLITTETTSKTISYNSVGNLLIVALSSVFKTVAPNSVKWNGLAMSQQGGVLSPNELSKCELYSLYNPNSGTHNLVIQGDDVFVGTVTIYSFSGANRNPINDIRTQTGTTGQNPSLSLNSNSDFFSISVISNDTGTVTLTMGAGQDVRGNQAFGTVNCTGYGGGSSKTGASSMTGTWSAPSASWAHLAASLRGVIPLMPTMTSRLVDTDSLYQWIIRRR